MNIQTRLGGVSYTLPQDLSGAYDSFVLSLFRSLGSWIYGFHMPLFFALAGAVLAVRPSRSFDTFVLKKTKRLLVPFFVYGWLFMLPVKYLGNFYNEQSLREALTAFLSGSEGGHLWFLPALFWCMVIFVVIERILRRYTPSVVLRLLVAGLVQCVYMQYVDFSVFYLKTGIEYLFWFALGYVFEHFRTEFEALGRKRILLLFLVVATLEAVQYKYRLFNEFFTILCGIVFSLLLSYLCAWIFRWGSKRWWKIAMRDMFYVYIFHDPLEYLVLRLFLGQGYLASSAGCYLYLLCRTAVIFAVSVALGESIRKLKQMVLAPKPLFPAAK